MRISPALVLTLGVSLALSASNCPAAVSNTRVEAAIGKAKAFLYSQQKNGTWDAAPLGDHTNDNAPNGAQYGGVTALVTYALLATGENPQDAKLAPAIAFLKKVEMRGTYALALRLQVWLLLPASKEVKALAQRDAAQLLAMTQSRGTARGMHDYTALGHGYSHSRSQYAVLGLWAAEQIGVEVPARYWETSEAGWLDHQDASGGWTYMAPAEVPIGPTPGMTAAGVATMFITQDYLHAGGDCHGNVNNRSIDAGVAWLAKNFDKVATDTRFYRDFPFATLYAVERVGVAGGLKYFGDHDWYDAGANWALTRQKADGSFATAEKDSPFGPLVDTSFATLFLARGRAPVAVNKLDYTSDPKKPAAWNQRPRDVANLVRWTGRQLERDLNWQVVNLNVSAEELLDAPILYLAGSQPIVVTDAQAQKLKTFVEMGGLIVGNADCGSVPFGASFRKLGEKLFGYEFRELPPDHVVYNNPFKYAGWKAKPQVQGQSNGARELMLLVHAGDPGKMWQMRAVKGREESWQLAANIFLYSCDQKDLRYKGETRPITVDRAVAPTRKVSLARLQYAGNWDPEPGGWRRMAAVMNNRHGLEMSVEAVTLGEGKLAGKKIAHLTGTSRFTLNDASLEELRRFVSGDGLLVIDAAGGAADFADSADALVRTLFPDAKARMLPAEHPLYQIDDRPIPVEYRSYTRKTLVGGARTGRLIGVEVNNRLAIVISREDLSVGLVGQSVDGVLGYSPETATNLMAAIVLSASPKSPQAPATGPATRPGAASTKPAAPAKKGEAGKPEKLEF